MKRENPEDFRAKVVRDRTRRLRERSERALSDYIGEKKESSCSPEGVSKKESRVERTTRKDTRS